MARLVVAVAIGLVALAAAAVIERRRRRDPPTQPAWDAPAQLDRADFPRASAPWLVVVFSSATCNTCARAVEVAKALARGDTEVVDVAVDTSPDLHRRYRIDAVPITVVADDAGVVRVNFIGPVSSTDLHDAVARLRD